MKKYLIISICIAMLGVITPGKAQLVKTQQQANKLRGDWYNASFEKEGVYGAAVDEAYAFLQGKKVKKQPIVALIGGGMDVEHEDLKDAIWINRKEKPNGKDNDRNGYVGDLYGWNFLGGKDGRVMEHTMQEGDREFLRLKDKYGDYLFDGNNYWKVVDEKLVRAEAPENPEEYKYYRWQVLSESQLGGTYGGWQISYVVQKYARQFDSIMQHRFPGKELTVNEFGTCYDPKAPVDSLRDKAYILIAYAFAIMETDSWEVVKRRFIDNNVARARDAYEKMLAQKGYDGRQEIVGDNVMDLNDKRYGNNVLLTSNAVAGVMQAGVIAGKRGNGLGGDGIAANARIMTLRTHGNHGEPYLKDYALAIRYAVDHGADIIVLGEQNTLYPPLQKKWMEDALEYAERKGVLVIVPVWELARDLSKHTFYPNRFMIPGKELGNLMVVASSDQNGNPSMQANYGMNELDLFAPGIDIYSSYIGDTYRTGSSTALSAATVAGVAALIKTYYPRLTGTQIRQILLKSVTSRKDAEVEKGIVINGNNTQDLFLFGDLCLSGGIINALQAVRMADEMKK